MKVRIFAVLALVLSSMLASVPAVAADAFADACAQQVSGLRAVEVIAGAVKVAPDLRRVSSVVLGAEKNGVAHTTDNVVLGHTSTTLLTDTSVAVTGIEHASGTSFCYKPSISVWLEYTPLVVSVGTEVADACVMDYVLEHEQEHIRIYKDALPLIAAELEAELESKFSMKVADSEESAIQESNAAVEALVVPTVKALIAKHSQAVHEAFDKEDQAHMDAHACAPKIYATAKQIATVVK